MNAREKYMQQRAEILDIPEQEQDIKKRAEGASLSKNCVRFVPLKGDWISLPYHLLKKVTGDRQFTRIVAEFVEYRVTITGKNLKGLADRLEAGRLPDVIEMDPLHYQASNGEYAVEKLTVEAIEEE